jgi:hypothetical protein
VVLYLSSLKWIHPSSLNWDLNPEVDLDEKWLDHSSSKVRVVTLIPERSHFKP